MSALALALLVAAGACGRNSSRAADTSLNTDLSLAAQQSHSLDTLSAAERSPAPNASKGTVATRSAPSTHRSTGSSGRVSSSGGAATSAGHVEKHTQRDAAIGAAAGAIIGATTSRDKIKGGVIGAAVGGVLGGVIGNNVDKKKVP